VTRSGQLPRVRCLLAPPFQPGPDDGDKEDRKRGGARRTGTRGGSARPSAGAVKDVSGGSGAVVRVLAGAFACPQPAKHPGLEETPMDLSAVALEVVVLERARGAGEAVPSDGRWLLHGFRAVSHFTVDCGPDGGDDGGHWEALDWIANALGKVGRRGEGRAQWWCVCGGGS